MECREVREYLPAYIDQPKSQYSHLIDDHISSCDGCTAELGQYKQMQIDLSKIATESIEPPAWLMGTLVETVSERAARYEAIRKNVEKVTDPRILTGGAIVAAGLGAIVVMRRRRKRGVGHRLRQALSEA